MLRQCRHHSNLRRLQKFETSRVSNITVILYRHRVGVTITEHSGDRKVARCSEQSIWCSDGATRTIWRTLEIYPYLVGVADFWDNYLVLRNGVYVSLNDAASEGTGANTNPATTLSFLRLMYPSLIQISELLDQDAEKRSEWRTIQSHIAPFTIVPASSLYWLGKLAPALTAGKNVIRDSESGPDFPTPQVAVYQDHRQRGSSAGMNQTQAVFPGWSFGLESKPEDLAAALNTVTLAAEWYDYNDDCTFYPAAADVGYDPAQILQNLDALIQTSQTPNFMIHTGGGGTEDFAITPVTISSMFVQSYQSSIHVFPNWPMSMDASFANLNACGGFLISSKLSGERSSMCGLRVTLARSAISPILGRLLRFVWKSTESCMLVSMHHC